MLVDKPNGHVNGSQQPDGAHPTPQGIDLYPALNTTLSTYVFTMFPYARPVESASPPTDTDHRYQPKQASVSAALYVVDHLAGSPYPATTLRKPHLRPPSRGQSELHGRVREDEGNRSDRDRNAAGSFKSIGLVGSARSDPGIGGWVRKAEELSLPGDIPVGRQGRSSKGSAVTPRDVGQREREKRPGGALVRALPQPPPPRFRARSLLPCEGVIGHLDPCDGPVGTGTRPLVPTATHHCALSV